MEFKWDVNQCVLMIDAATFESAPPIFCGGLAIVIITMALSAEPRLTSQGVAALREEEQDLITRASAHRSYCDVSTSSRKSVL
jgi:hypothetical protein